MNWIFVRGTKMALLLCSDLCIALVLVLVTALVGMAMQFVWQPLDRKGPSAGWHTVAVALATGQGFRLLKSEPGTPLDEFLQRNRPNLRPDEVPHDQKEMPADTFHQTHRYLFYLIGAVWWLFGLSWQAIDMMMVVALCATALVLYGLFRLGMNRLFSLLGVFVFVSSPLMLINLRVERDFLKAPFILGALLIMGYLAKRALPLRAYIGLAALLGAVLGIGLGFRQDLFIFIVPAVGVLAFCPCDQEGRAILRRAGGIAVMLALWFVTAYPILGVMRVGGSQCFHSLAGGIGCDHNLAIDYGSFRLLQSESDHELIESYSSFATRTAGEPPTLVFYSGAAEGRARRFVEEAALTYPADFVTRAYAATLYVFEAQWGTFSFRTSAPFAALDRMRASITRHWLKYRFLYLSAACLLLGLANRRTAFLVFFLVLYCCYTSSMQFQTRHVFHLCFLPLWCMGFVADRALNGVTGGILILKRRAWRCIRITRAPFVSVALYVACLLCIIFLPLYACRAWQHMKVKAILPHYLSAQLEPIPTEQKPVENGRYTLFAPVQWSAPASEDFAAGYKEGKDGTFLAFLRTDYLVAEFDTDTTGLEVLPKFEASSPWYPLPPIRVKLADAKQPPRVRLFIPVYETARAFNEGESKWFVGIAVPARNASAFKGLYRVKNLSDFRLLPTLILPSDPSYFQPCHEIPGGSFSGA